MVCSTKFPGSPLPQHGPEIPIKLQVENEKASLEISRKMKGSVLDNYLKAEKILLDVKTEEDEDNEFFVTF